MDKTLPIQKCLDLLDENIKEVEDLYNLHKEAPTWVVVYGEDFLPFRTNGAAIMLFGGPVREYKTETNAKGIANILQLQAGIYRVQAMPTKEWAPKRLEVLQKLRKQMQEAIYG